MSLADSLRNMQNEEKEEKQRQQEKFNQPMPDSLALEIATVIYHYIADELTRKVKSRQFDYYNGMFGTKTNCRYEVTWNFGMNSVIPDDVKIRKNDYMDQWYNDGTTFATWKLEDASRIISHLVPLLHNDGIKTQKQKKHHKGGEILPSHYYIEFTAILPCNSNGDIR